MQISQQAWALGFILMFGGVIHAAGSGNQMRAISAASGLEHMVGGYYIKIADIHSADSKSLIQVQCKDGTTAIGRVERSYGTPYLHIVNIVKEESKEGKQSPSLMLQRFKVALAQIPRRTSMSGVSGPSVAQYAAELD